MLCAPAAENEKAGITIFQNETHFYFLCKSVTDHEPVVQLFRSVPARDVDNHMELLAEQRLTKEECTQSLRLTIEAHGNTYAFLYGVGGKHLRVLKDSVDATFLSTKIAGGFVGCIYALYATSLGEATNTRAYFDWFEYTGNDEVYEGERR